MAWTENDIPDQSGRTAVITGANSGIGYEAARALAQHGAHVVLACRSRSKAEDAARRIEATKPSGAVTLVDCDLADFESVKAAVALIAATHDRVDLLINNAGVMALPNMKTAQGHEMQFGTNHLGHFLLTGLLIDRVITAPDSRIVTVASQAHRFGKIKLDDLNGEKKYSAWGAYGQSKLANILFTLELQRRLSAAGLSTKAVTAHPGWSRTNLGTIPDGRLAAMVSKVRPVAERAMAQPATGGALPTLRAATDPSVRGGDYYGPDGFNQMKGSPVLVTSNDRGRDADMAAKLWTASEQLTGVSFRLIAG
jgi:NAD(P)-dependent dehydrogenase (short-subunit alcohol dehydrogenase family)